METITGVEIFPLISFAIFFLFFLGLLLYVFTADKKSIAAMANMPLDLEDGTKQDADQSHAQN